MSNILNMYSLIIILQISLSLSAVCKEGSNNCAKCNPVTKLCIKCNKDIYSLNIQMIIFEQISFRDI